jgi:hypothetical protein
LVAALVALKLYDRPVGRTEFLEVPKRKDKHPAAGGLRRDGVSLYFRQPITTGKLSRYFGFTQGLTVSAGKAHFVFISIDGVDDAFQDRKRPAIAKDSGVVVIGDWRKTDWDLK